MRGGGASIGREGGGRGTSCHGEGERGVLKRVLVHQECTILSECIGIPNYF